MQLIIGDYGHWYVGESRLKVAKAKDCINILTTLSHNQALSRDQECQLSEAHACVNFDAQVKLQKWQVRSRGNQISHKGCSSKQFFKHLHAYRQLDKIVRTTKSDGTWTSSKLELIAECERYFASLFNCNLQVEQATIDARQLFLQCVHPILDDASSMQYEMPFIEEEITNALHKLGHWKSPG